MKTRILLSVLAFAFALGGRVPAIAQDVSSATMKGTVTDQNKAVVAGATVTAKSNERGTTRTVKTGGDGVYVIPALQPGSYELRIEASGFDVTVISNAEVTVGQIAVLDVELRPGGVKVQVEITTEAPVIEVERTQQANTIQQRQVDNFPNINRSMTA